MNISVPIKKQLLLLKEFHYKSDFLNECCNQISIENSEEIVWRNPLLEQIPLHKNVLYVLKNVPSYLAFSYKLDTGKKIRKNQSVDGYAIRLTDFLSLEQYVKQHFSTNTRGNILRSLRRLENSFEITYQRFYGEIESKKLSYLLNALKEMVITRFQERNDESDDLKNWGQLESNLEILINARKASIFTISHEHRPIAISICYHYGKTIFYNTPSYDINYSKFSLGNIMLYKQLEWGFANQYKFFDMGWGKMDYKIRWCNYISPLQNHVVYPNKSIPAYLLSIWEGHKTRLNYYLRRPKKLPQRKGNKVAKIKTYDFEDFGEIDGNKKEYLPVNVKMELDPHLKSMLIDFIYRYKEHYSDVMLYKSTDNPSFYIIQGKKCTKKVMFT